MAYAEISNGVVVNSVEASVAFAEAHSLVLMPEGVGIGWLYQSGTFTPPAPATDPIPDMAERRKEALASAMAYGNAITARETSQWAGVEPLSWSQQRDEALIVKEGGTLSPFAVLPSLAEDKGVPLSVYAEDVLANAARYQTLLRAAVSLRRLATQTLLDEALNTPEKLSAAVADLKVHTDELAARLLAGSA